PLPAERRPQPSARRPGGRQARRLRGADPPRPVHLRLPRACSAALARGRRRDAPRGARGELPRASDPRRDTAHRGPCARGRPRRPRHDDQGAARRGRRRKRLRAALCESRRRHGRMNTMKLAKEIWIVGAKRTAFGAMHGAFKSVTATDLRAEAAKAAVAQSGVPVEDFGHVIVGNVLQTQKEAIFCARHVGLKAGLPIEVPAITLNRLCGSGFQAVISAAEQILLGDAVAVLAVGTENMSQAPHSMWGLREGARFGKPPEMVDTLWAALTDSFCNTPMAITAENLAAEYGISREQCDAFALRSQQRWAAGQ